MLLIYYFLVLTAIYIFMGWSLYLPYRVGHLNFLSISIMAISAYFTGIASRELDLPFIIIIISGMLIGIIINYGVSLLVGDAPCFTVVIVGLTSIFIVKTVVENWEYLGGSIGFFGIPATKYLLVWTYILLIGVGYLIWLIDSAQITREASVIFHDRQLGLSLGIQRKKIAPFFHSFSGMLAGLSGVLYASLIGGLTIDFFGFGIVGALMAILFVGGYSSMWGVMLAAPLLGSIPILLPDTLTVWKQVIYGALLIIMICFRSKGLITRRQIIKLKDNLKREKYS